MKVKNNPPAFMRRIFRIVLPLFAGMVMLMFFYFHLCSTAKSCVAEPQLLAIILAPVAVAIWIYGFVGMVRIGYFLHCPACGAQYRKSFGKYAMRNGGMGGLRCLLYGVCLNCGYCDIKEHNESALYEMIDGELRLKT